MLKNDIDPSWAWAAFEPTDKEPWDLKRAGHLYRRAAFGATWSELQAAANDGPQKTVERLLGGAADPAFDRQMAEMAAAIGPNDEESLRAWWLLRMLLTPHPVQERLTLFWHNHFATSIVKVRSARLMLAQNELLRRHALGNFGQLLQDISKDPAMLVWLDTNQNKKGRANENYARELMELFSLGIGNYTEQDVREGARAFTGWQLKREQSQFDELLHDNGQKTFLGHNGAWKGEDIVKFCLAHEAAPYFIAGKLFRCFVSETIMPSRELLAPLAQQLRKSNWEIRETLSVILRSNLFHSDLTYRSRVKSPVEFGIGIVRALEGQVGALPLVEALDGLGQRLLAPPSVKGWDGGTAWINSTMLLLRHNLALALTSTQDSRFGRRTDPAALLKKHNRQSDAQIVEFLVQLFLQGDLPKETTAELIDYLQAAGKHVYPKFWSDTDQAEHRVRTVCHLLLTQPEFQLA